MRRWEIREVEEETSCLYARGGVQAAGAPVQGCTASSANLWGPPQGGHGSTLSPSPSLPCVRCH